MTPPGAAARTYASPPTWLLELLTVHLPYSLPLLRRLQFLLLHPGHAGGRRRGHAPARVLFASDADDLGDAAETPFRHARFAAALVEPGRAPETEMCVYATLEDRRHATAAATPTAMATARRRLLDGAADEDEAEDEDVAAAQLRAVLRAAAEAVGDAAAAREREREQEQEGKGEGEGEGDGADGLGLGLGPSPRRVVVGDLSAALRDLLAARGVRFSDRTGARVDYVKWLLRAEEMVGPAAELLPDGLRWDVVREGDYGTVIARTDIPRTAATLATFPSAAIRTDDGTAIAWAFLSGSGSLASLHVEEPYRGRGLAKAIAAKLIRERSKDFGDDGWCHVDVRTENQASSSVVKSLGGRPGWTVSWTRVEFYSVL